MSGDKKHLVIIGGGITGLAAAFYMEKEIKEKQLPLEVTLIEAGREPAAKFRRRIKTATSLSGPGFFFGKEKKRAAARQGFGA